jgi:hypothetical protein
LAPSSQQHDFNPGIAPSGLFWTVPVSHESVKIEFDDDDREPPTASLKVANLAIEDYHTLANALVDGPSVDGTVSFEVRWSGVKQRLNIRNSQLMFTGSFVEDLATIVWSARTTDGFAFTSDGAQSTQSAFAIIGRERNGVFFR